MTIKKIIQTALDENMVELQSTFNNEMLNRLQTKMDEKKKAIASTYFAQTKE
jgi:hypothetical protein